MKTFSRLFWEEQYRRICEDNPIVPMYLSFAKLLTGDHEEVLKCIRGIPQHLSKESPDFIYRILAEINEYGHSLVLIMSESEVEYDQSGISEVLGSMKRDLVVNLADGESCIRLQGRPSFVKFGNKTYECRHIHVFGFAGCFEFFVPIDGSKRMFTSSSVPACKSCKEKMCIKDRNNPSISVYMAHREEYAFVNSSPYDLHSADCDVRNLVSYVLAILRTAITKYNENSEKVSVSVTKHRAENNKKSSGKHVDSCTIDASETIVPVSQYKASKKAEGKGGTHASPVAHTVSGFWRRRSKYDDTLIFVKSFPRGGTEQERQKLKSDIGMKQKVYKV